MRITGPCSIEDEKFIDIARAVKKLGETHQTCETDTPSFADPVWRRTRTFLWSCVGIKGCPVLLCT